MPHFLLSDLVVTRKKLDPKFTGGIQQVIAVLETDDGLKIADVYDYTAFPEINDANVNTLFAAGDLRAVVEFLQTRLGSDNISLSSLVGDTGNTTLRDLVFRAYAKMTGK